MAEVTIMVLRVDLGCEKCRRKIKKLLCKYHEIRDQTYYDKEDTVIIKVVCCSPERIRQKLICKGGKTIKSIEIRIPEKPKPPAPEKPKEAEKPKPMPPPPQPKPPAPEKPKEAEKPKPPPEKPKEADKPKPPPEKPKEAEKPKPPPEKPKEAEKPKPPPEKPKSADPPKADKPVEKPPPPAPVPAPVPVNGYPQIFPVAVCCKPCYEVGYVGPCQHGYGIPYQPPSSYDGYVRLVPSYDGPPAAAGWPSSGCRCNRSYGCRCEYFTEENPACTIM